MIWLAKIYDYISNKRLINSIERDGRKVFTVKEENDYMHKVINMLVEFILNMALVLIDETLSVLESINGRKNPSTTQTKQLKRCIPNMTILKPLIASQVIKLNYLVIIKWR